LARTNISPTATRQDDAPPKNKTAAGLEGCLSETALCLPDKEIPYEEIFYRETDTIVLKARKVELVDRGYAAATVRLRPRP